MTRGGTAWWRSPTSLRNSAIGLHEATSSMKGLGNKPAILSSCTRACSDYFASCDRRSSTPAIWPRWNPWFRRGPVASRSVFMANTAGTPRTWTDRAAGFAGCGGHIAHSLPAMSLSRSIWRTTWCSAWASVGSASPNSIMASTLPSSSPARETVDAFWIAPSRIPTSGSSERWAECRR